MKKFSTVFFAFLSLAFFVACNDKKENTPIVPLVEGIKITKNDIAMDAEYPAQVAGSADVDVRAQVSGILKQKFFKEGEYVEKDKELFLIDPEQYEIALQKAKGTLSQADSDVKKTKRDYERMKTLFKENAVSRKDHDDSLSAYEKAQANYQVAKSGVDEAQRNLNNTKVTAPASGVTRNDKYSEGNLISTTGESSLLLNIVQIDPLEIRFSVPAQQWNGFRINYGSGKLVLPRDLGNMTVDVQVITADGSPYEQVGKMKFLDAAEDANTGTINAKADVPNPDKKRILMPGQFVKVVIKGLVYKNAMILPQTAVLSTAKGSMVYVVDAEGKAVLTPVTTMAYKDYFIVEGLKEGDTVVTSGIIKVKANNPVKVELKDFDISAFTTLYTPAAAPVAAAEPQEPETEEAGK
ncbi:membrane fusion protein (multidrug efflux system) [Elusimicrobium posterum]|uniref:efflux RND transporter periplasmic adaptor subunit n=1 Tax=Elusimicrobium posterum TaxID=3116653 RepID=UPI003C72600A